MQDIKNSITASFTNSVNFFEALLVPEIKKLVWDLSNIEDATIFAHRLNTEIVEYIELISSNEIRLESFTILHRMFTLQKHLVEEKTEVRAYLDTFAKLTTKLNCGNIIFKSIDKNIQEKIFKPFRTNLPIVALPAEAHPLRKINPPTFQTLRDFYTLIRDRIEFNKIIWDCQSSKSLYLDFVLIMDRLENESPPIDLEILHNDKELQQLIHTKSQPKTAIQTAFFEILNDYNVDVTFTLKHTTKEKEVGSEQVGSNGQKRKLEDSKADVPPTKKAKIINETVISIPKEQTDTQKAEIYPSLQATNGNANNSNEVHTSYPIQSLQPEKNKLTLAKTTHLSPEFYYSWKDTFFSRHLIAKNKTYFEKGWRSPLLFPWAQVLDFVIDYLTDEDIVHTSLTADVLSYTQSNVLIRFIDGELPYNPYIFNLPPLMFQKLHSLYLPRMKLGDEVIVRLFNTLDKVKNDTLINIDLSDNNLTENSVGLVGNFIARTTGIKDLNLSHNPIGSAGLKALLNGEYNGDILNSGGLKDCNSIDTLDLSYIGIDKEEATLEARSTMRRLGTIIATIRLKALILRGNNITDYTLGNFLIPLRAINNSDPSNASLNLLDLSKNNLHKPTPLLELAKSSINYLSILDNPLDLDFSIKLTWNIFKSTNMIVFECSLSSKNQIEHLINQEQFSYFLNNLGMSPKLYLLQFKCPLHNSLIPINIRVALQENRNKFISYSEIIAVSSSYEVLSELAENESEFFDSVVNILRWAPPESEIIKWGKTAVQSRIGEDNYDLVLDV